jgi:CheY-like chemotaxis protein
MASVLLAVMDTVLTTPRTTLDGNRVFSNAFSDRNLAIAEINRLQRCINDLVAYCRIPKYGQKLYQRPIDANYGVAHCVVMRFHARNGAAEVSLLSVVDDDEMPRESLPDLLRELGFTARVFSSGQEFFSSDYVGEINCLILDVAMSGMSGLDLQRELKRRGKEIPIIFITGQKDDQIWKQAFRQGAVKFLYKPVSDSDLLHAVNAALDWV